MKKSPSNSKKEVSSDEELMDAVSLSFELERMKLKYTSLQERYDALFEKTNDAIFLIDKETERFLFANKKAAEMFGFDLKDAIKYSAKDFIMEEAISDANQKMSIAKRGKTLPIYERKFKRLNGEVFIGEINLSLIHDSISGTDFIQSIIRDVTIRKQKEKIITRDRQIYHDIATAAIESTDIPEFCNLVLSTLIENLDFTFGSIRVINNESNCFDPLAIQGLSAHLTQSLKPIKLTDTKYLVSEIIHTKKPIYVEDFRDHPLFGKYKERVEIFDIRAFISWPILNKNNDIIGTIQISSSEPKNIVEEDKFFFESIIVLLVSALEKFIAEKELDEITAEREELFKIINLSPAIIFLWRNQAGWPVEYVSDNIKLLGYSPDDFYSGAISYRNLIHPDDTIVESIDIDLHSQKSYPYKFPIDYRIKTKDGLYKTILEYSSPRYDIEGNITHYYGIILDISERVKYENYLKNERTALKVLAETIIQSSHVKDLCQNILTEFTKLLRFERGSIRIYDPINQTLNRIAELNLTDKFSRIDREISINNQDYIIPLVARNKEAIFIPNISEFHLDANLKETMNQLDIKSMITWPLLGTDDELFGVMQILSSDVVDISDDDKIFFESTTRLLSSAIQRFQTEDELAQSYKEREQLDYIINLSPAIVFLWKNEIGWPVEFVSENIVQLGYTQEEFQSRKLHYADIVYKEDLDRVTTFANKQISNSNITEYSIQYRIITKSGAIRWVDEYTTIQRDKENNVTYFMGIIIDITYSKKAEQALKKERQAFQMIADAAAISNTVPDLCQYILNGLVDIFKFDIGSVRIYDKESQLLNNIADVRISTIRETGEIPSISIDNPDYVNALVARTKQAIFAPNVVKNDLINNYHKNLEKINVKALITYPILKTNNELLGTLQLASHELIDLADEDHILFDTLVETLSHSIDRLLVDQARRESEEKFKRTVDNITNGITIIENGELVYINQRALDIFGYTRDEIKKMKRFAFITPEDQTLHKKHEKDIFTHFDGIEDVEYWFIRKDGERRCVNNRHSMIRKDDKNYSLYILSTDITDRKLAEEALKRLNEVLEERVKERTKQLEQMNKELEAFSYSVSHDLRTPLRSIDGFSQALLEDYEDNLDEMGKDYLTRIRSAATRMSNLIDDLLALSRLTRKEIVSKNIDLTKLCKNIIEEFKTNEPNRRIKISIEKDMNIIGDTTLIRTVMENLIGNAWKFTRKKTKPKISIGKKTINKETVYFIKDNGVGFDMAYADKLFAVFQRLHSYKEFEGTGIGLAIVQRIINKHNGQIWAESKPKKGAKFFFTIGDSSEINQIEENIK